MMRPFAHRQPAARGPDRGGALLGLWGAVYGAKYLNDCEDCTGAEAPARHAGGVPIKSGAPLVRRAVGRSRGGACRALSPRGVPHD
ncbi:hypothetical protein ACSSV6_002653 [Roseovarius sp. MBR-38]|jgi:hypothetical protein